MAKVRDAAAADKHAWLEQLPLALSEAQRDMDAEREVVEGLPRVAINFDFGPAERLVVTAHVPGPEPVEAAAARASGNEDSPLYSRWLIEWRGDQRLVGGGDVILLERSDGAVWRVVVPLAYARPWGKLARVPMSFTTSAHAAVVSWKDDSIGGFGWARRDRDRKLTIGSCWDGLQRVVQNERDNEKERAYKSARGDYLRAFDRSMKAAEKLVEELSELCRLEDGRPAEAMRELWAALAERHPVPGKPEGDLWKPSSKRSFGRTLSLDTLRRMAEAVVAQLPIHRPSTRGRGNPGDSEKAAVEAPLRALGMDDTEVAQQLRALGLESWKDGKPGRSARLTGKAYARKRSRQRKRYRAKSTTRKRK